MVHPKSYNRSEWVAVAPEYSRANLGEGDRSNSHGDRDEGGLPTVTPASTAYQFFQRENTARIREQLLARGEVADLAHLTKATSQAWKELHVSERAYYEELASKDQCRFQQESQVRDAAVLERRDKLRKERDEIILSHDGRRSTRGSHLREKKKAAKRARKASKEGSVDFEKDESKYTKLGKTSKTMDNMDNSDEDEYSHYSREHYSDSSDDSCNGSTSDSSDSDGNHFPAKKKPLVKPVSAAVAARRELNRKNKEDTETYIAQRQSQLRNERTTQAKKRLDFLIKQSDIFRHFGQIKEDRAKFFSHRGDSTVSSSRMDLESSNPPSDAPEDTSSTIGIHERDVRSQVRRGNFSSTTEIEEAEELEQVDEHPATFLTSQPSTLGFGQMRTYQLEALNWMIRLQENGVNGILADEMGLGKTLQSIAMLVYMKEYQDINGPHLIVVPKSTLSNWMNELQRWAPTLTTVKFHGTKEERDDIATNTLKPGHRDDRRTWDVVVTTYEVCNKEKNVLDKFAWCYLIIDEAHRLKNEASTFSTTIRTFETRFRLLLTGTPLQNNLHELWALLNFLVPDVFASAEQFDQWFNLDIEDADEKNKLISQLHKILRPFMLRRLKVDVETDLPPKHETILFTGMSAMQKKLYKDILMRDVDVLQGTAGGGAGNRTAILNIVMQLRKCAGHPYLFPGVEDRSLPALGEHLVENCGKMVLLDKLLIRLQELGHRILLFSQMTRCLDILEDYMVMRQFKYCRIDGSTDYEKREESINAFNAPNSDKFIFLLSTRAGGLGINLQTADVVILYDSDWNPMMDLQAQDRAHRIGQKKSVQVFRLVTESTIEEKIIERAQQKLKLDAMVVQQGRLKERDKLSREELLEAVRFGADKIFKSKDSSITDDDIDLIIEAGKKKTQELNDKLQAAEKGDLLDFKLDGGFSAQTFEGVDYSKQDLALAKAAQAQAELFCILDMGKRERRAVANYNENELFRSQVITQHVEKKKKKDVNKLPVYLRLPRMEEWQMFDRHALKLLQEEEEAAFLALPEDIQKLAKKKLHISNEDWSRDMNGMDVDALNPNSFVDDSLTTSDDKIGTGSLPPLLSVDKQREKERLLSEGFTDWDKTHYLAFVKASGAYGRNNFTKIALEVGKAISDVEVYASAFWDVNIGKKRISESEYDRQVKSIERGERKLQEVKSLERSTSIFLSLFDDPWRSLEFTHVSCKDKLFSIEEDRFLLCWAHKFGYAQWEAVKFAIRRSPEFRFDYFIRSLPAKAIGVRCEQLMKAAEKEVEILGKKYMDNSVTDNTDRENEAIDGRRKMSLPSFKQVQEMKRQQALQDHSAEEQGLKAKVKEAEEKVDRLKKRIKALQEYPNRVDKKSAKSNKIPIFPEESIPLLANIVALSGSVSSTTIATDFLTQNKADISKKVVCGKIEEIARKEKRDEGDRKAVWHLLPEYTKHLTTETLGRMHTAKEVVSEINQDSTCLRDGALGPEGDFVPFPNYDGIEEPREARKAFTLFCSGSRREVKDSLDAQARTDKEKVNSILRDMWIKLNTSDKIVWKKWEEWDAKRYERDELVFKNVHRKKRSSASAEDEVKAVKLIDSNKGKNRLSSDASLTNVSSDIKVKRVHDDSKNSLITMDVSQSFHVPKRRKGDFN